MDRAQNIIVIKTLPGLASGSCGSFDSMEYDGLVGSIAGDDTGLLIMRDNDCAERFMNEMGKGF